MEYAQVLCFLGELYRDMEMPSEAIEALDKGIRLHEIASERQGPDAGRQASLQMVSGLSVVGQD